MRVSEFYNRPILSDLTPFVSPSFTVYEAGTSLDRHGDTKVCLSRLPFCWIPGHVGIRGTEKAESAAMPRVKVGVPNTDFKHHINQYIMSTWQDDWNGAVANKLHSIKPLLGDWQSFYRQWMKDEVVVL